jgi:hypothetical protein
METIPLALFGDRKKAEPVQQRLVQAGFNASINDRPRLTCLWFESHDTAGVRVEVPADQFGNAEQFLLNWDAAEGALDQAIRCPECHSLRVDYPQYAKHSLLTNLGMGLLAQVGFVEKDYYCEDCHYTWPKEGTRARRDRSHLAPFYFIEGIEQTTLKHRGVQPSNSTLPEEHRKAA